MRRRSTRNERAALCLALVAWSCGHGAPASEVQAGVSVAAAADDPIAFGEVPEFTLTDQTGATVTRETLLGRPFVVAAVFTTCTGPCPRIASEMQTLQAALQDTDALLVSVSVDPAHDSPAVLAEYAEALGARPERWRFLTGAEEAVYRLLREGFWLGVERADDQAPFGRQVTHATRLVAVDRAGRIRGWYESESEEGLAALRARMLHLSAER